jgi:hypothetical protein
VNYTFRFLHLNVRFVAMVSCRKKKLIPHIQCDHRFRFLDDYISQSRCAMIKITFCSMAVSVQQKSITRGRVTLCDNTHVNVKPVCQERVKCSNKTSYIDLSCNINYVNTSVLRKSQAFVWYKKYWIIY